MTADEDVGHERISIESWDGGCFAYIGRNGVHNKILLGNPYFQGLIR